MPPAFTLAQCGLVCDFGRLTDGRSEGRLAQASCAIGWRLRRRIVDRLPAASDLPIYPGSVPAEAGLDACWRDVSEKQEKQPRSQERGGVIGARVSLQWLQLSLQHRVSLQNEAFQLGMPVVSRCDSGVVLVH